MIQFSDLSKQYQNDILLKLSVRTSSNNETPLLLNMFDFMTVVIFVVRIKTGMLAKKEVVWNHQLQTLFVTYFFTGITFQHKVRHTSSSWRILCLV